MLYIFQVDTGTMLTFEMNLALDSVSTLQSTISTRYGIPSSAQVLLISGGQPLLPSQPRVCSNQFYTNDSNNCVGTDTNPIFLFNKLNIENCQNSSPQSPSSPGQQQTIRLAVSPSPWQQQLYEDLQSILSSSDSEIITNYSVLLNRTQKSQNIYELSKELVLKSEKLIQDQHLQHQGWASVVANLCDIVGVFKLKVEKFEGLLRDEFGKFVEKLEVEGVVESLPSTIQSLSKLQLPPSLIPHYNNHSHGNITNLLDWLIATTNAPSSSSSPSNNSSTGTNGNSILDIQSNYQKTIEKILDKSTMETLLKDSQSVLEKSSSQQMREIKGLSNRLYKLDELLSTTKKLLKEQQELNQSMVNMTTRANDFKTDQQLLRELCNSHKKQLQVLFENLKKIDDIHKRCYRAKEELILNLNSRLKWVIYVQKQISESHLKISVYFESFKKFKQLNLIIEQICSMESVYFEILQELSRRWEFNCFYNEQVGVIFDSFKNEVSLEIEKRKKFDDKFKSHFLFTEFMNNVFCRGCESVSDFKELEAVFLSQDVMCLKRLKVSENQDCCPGNYIDFNGVRKLFPWREFNNHHGEVRACLVAKGREEVLDEKSREKEIEELKIRHEIEMDNLRRELSEKYEKEIYEIKEKCKSDIDGVKSRARFFMDKNQQLSPQQQQKEFPIMPGSSSSPLNFAMMGTSPRQASPLSQKHETENDDEEKKLSIAMGTSCVVTTGEDLSAAALPLEKCSCNEGDNNQDCDEEEDGESDDVPDVVITTSRKLTQKTSQNGTKKIGDTALIYYSNRYEAFIVYNEQKNKSHHGNKSRNCSVHGDKSSSPPSTMKSSSSSLHFVHTETTQDLMKDCCYLGTIVDKEYCVARRATNRYRVPQGFHFYRIKLLISEKFCLF